MAMDQASAGAGSEQVWPIGWLAKLCPVLACPTAAASQRSQGAEFPVVSRQPAAKRPAPQSMRGLRSAPSGTPLNSPNSKTTQNDSGSKRRQRLFIVIGQQAIS